MSQEKVSFARGATSAYQPSGKHKDAIYFDTQEKVVKMNGESYGGGNPQWIIAPKNYFYIENIGSTTGVVEFNKYGSFDTPRLQYSIDCNSWEDVDITQSYNVPAKTKIYMRNLDNFVSKSDFKYLEIHVGTDSVSQFAIGGDIRYMNNFGEMASNVFAFMFRGSKGLKDASALILPDDVASTCYYYMFSRCTSLVNAPELPATTLPYGCYGGMFNGCTSLVNAPELPATTLGEYCYCWMFANCTSLVNAPELPATTLAKSCYYSMFHGCTSLVNAPELPITTLTGSCYDSMFSGCKSLVSAPELPATTLQNNCYSEMFSGCTSLVNAPELPATTLKYQCYNSMFSGCTSLVNAPELPATTLANRCYQYMFNGCTSLVNAPELPATTLTEYCYRYMFNGCKKLSHIRALFITIPDTSYMTNWVSGVASSGTFVKSKDATWDVRGVSGIPEGWTVITE